jgi:glutamine amidotransferase
VLIDAHELWALRYPETHELFCLERSDPGGHLKGPSGGIKVQADAPAVVVASEPMDGDSGWTSIPSGHLLHVAPDLRTTLTAFEVDPLHILRHDELDHRAAASQTAK